MKWPIGKKIGAGFGLLLTILIIIGVNSFQSALKFIETSRLETKARVIVKKLEIVLTEITDAETGQRGYIITGDERYLEPYHVAIANIDYEVEDLSKLIRDNPDHQQRLDALKPLLAEKLAGLNERIGLRKNKGFEAAAQGVRSGKGRMVMDKIRKIITEIEDAEKKFLKQRSAEVEASSNRTIFIIIFGSSLAFVIVGIASFITHREFSERKRTEEALQNAYAELEQKVEERTVELCITNESLQKEITEHKQAEDALRESEETARTIINATTNYMALINSDGTIITLNETMAKSLGKNLNELIGTHIFDLFPHSVAEFRKAQTDKVVRSGKPVFYEDERAGRWFYSILYPIFDANGKVARIAVFVRDITERKHAEEKLKTALKEWRVTFDSTTDIIMLLDSEMKIIKTNLATTRFLNRPFNEILGKNCFQLFHGTDKPPAICPTDKMRMTKKHEEVELYLPEKDIWILVSADPIFDDKGNLTGSVHIIRDVTVRKKAEEKIQFYQDQLRSLASQLSLGEERERHRIATDLHDHIGQTLAISKIKLGALRELAFSTGLAESLDEIRELIEQAIQYTRSLTFELSPPILYELGFEAAVEWLGEQILKRHGIRFEFEDDGKPKPMDDEARILLFQAVRELLINVTKHAQARNAKVSIWRDGNDIRISVEDDGVGFDISKLDSYLRTGSFGIFSIRERLNRIKGYLNIESEPGKGSRVTVVAPLKI